MQHIEPDLERLLDRLVPGIELGWKGADEHEIAEIEAVVGRPVPRFYRWFLARMGRDMGALRYATTDFSAARVLACYREEIDEPDPRYLLIGYQDDVVPMHIWYDLDCPSRDDALVLSRAIGHGLIQRDFETFREMLAFKAMLNYRIGTLPSRCKGELSADGADVYARLERVLHPLGFEKPVSAGPCCGIFDRPDAALICRIGPDYADGDLLLFRLAADDPGIMRRILGVISRESGVEVTINA